MGPMQTEAWEAQMREGADDGPTQCPDCFGKGYNDKWCTVTGHHNGGEVLRIDCDTCEGRWVDYEDEP